MTFIDVSPTTTVVQLPDGPWTITAQTPNFYTIRSLLRSGASAPDILSYYGASYSFLYYLYYDGTTPTIYQLDHRCYFLRLRGHIEPDPSTFIGSFSSLQDLETTFPEYFI